MDTLAWGALLRYPAQDIQQLQKDRQRHSQLLVSNDPGNVLNARADAAQVLDRMAEVHASGLVAINLKGNLLTSTCAVRLAAGLSSNRWLLGESTTSSSVLAVCCDAFLNIVGCFFNLAES